MTEKALTYQQKLKIRIRRVGHGICVGIDPLIDRIPQANSNAEAVLRFYENMLGAFVRRGCLPAVVKPNIAFFEALGIEALFSLQKIIALYQGEGIPVILDAKRGDIGKTSKAYAQMAYTTYKADAITVAPYMGADSVQPFQEKDATKGVYILCRTSNPGSADFQALKLRDTNETLYIQVAKRIAQWSHGDLGAVVGATAPSEMCDLLDLWEKLGVAVPCLIPGISVGNVAGGQGGSLAEVLSCFSHTSHPDLQLVNSSSGINYAIEEISAKTPAEASAIALEQLVEEWQKRLSYPITPA